MDPRKVLIANLKGQAATLDRAVGDCPHNYLAKIEWLVASGRLSSGRGAVQDLAVCHDDWCGIHEGGYCNCDPELYLGGRLVPTPAIGKLLRRKEATT